MEKSFIKNSFIETLNSSINSIEEAKNAVKNIIPDKKFSSGLLNNLVNRKNYLQEVCQVLNTPTQNIVFISGFMGTGKTEFVNTIISALEENIFDFYYQCSPITHLDDIILAFFNYLKKISTANPENKKNFKISGNQSIDEKLMNGIKNLNKPLLIVIDGFEHLCGDNFKEEKELIRFIEFISSFPQIKMILAGQRFNSDIFPQNKDKYFEIKLGGLDEQNSQKLLQTNGITETESCFNQIYQTTRGYPENLLWFCKAVNLMGIEPFNLMQEYFSVNKTFEEFVYTKIFQLIPEEFHKLLCLFAVARHSFTIDSLKKLNFTKAVQEKSDYLKSAMILTENREGLYIKSLLKNTICSNISAEQKNEAHRYLYELYTEQISKKLEERIFHISRKLLYSEQYYHYMSLINNGDKSLPDIKSASLSHLKPDFRYLYANIADSLFTGETIEHQSKPENEVLLENENNTYKNEENNDSSTQNYEYLDINNIDEFNIELSEEEKALLTDKKPEDIKENIALPKAKQSSGLNIKAEIIKKEAQDFYEKGKYDEAIKKFDEAMVLYQILRDKNEVIQIMNSIANIYKETFKHDIALMYYHKILNNENINPETELKINILCSLADIYSYRESFDTAIKYYEKALIEAEKHKNPKELANIYFKTALLWDDSGNSEKALELYIKNTKTSQDIAINPYIAASYSNIASIYEELENMQQAIKYFQESLKFDSIINNNEGQYETLSKLGNIYFETEQYNKANEYFHKALEIARHANDIYKIAMSCLDIGDIHFQENNYEKALKAFITAGKTIEKTISTDSREKIERRFKQVINKIGEKSFKEIMGKLRKKHE